MATGNVKLTAIDVGQGQCTFVEIYDQSAIPVLTNTLLFDCGTNKESDCTTVNLEYVAAKAASKNPPGFDCIFFSHSDTDHTNQTKFVLEEIKKTIAPKKLEIGEVWYAGAHENYTKGKPEFNILDYIVEQKYCKAGDIGTLESNYTAYDPKKDAFKTYLWKTKDDSLKVRTIVANALSEDPDWTENNEDVSGTTPEARNMISLVCGVFYADTSYVICGDATNSTMSAAVKLFPKKTTLFDFNKMSTLPHHGSRRTGLAVARGKPAEKGAIEIVRTFAGLLNSRYLTDSAYEKHRHPSLELMNLFIPVKTTPGVADPRLKQKNSHCLSAYIDINLTNNSGIAFKEQWPYTFETLTNTFTTRYSDGSETFSYNLGDKQAKKSEGIKPGSVINNFACWSFYTSKDGDSWLDGYADMNKPDFTVAPSVLEEVAVATSLTARQIPPRPPAIRQSQFHNRLQRFR